MGDLPFNHNSVVQFFGTFSIITICDDEIAIHSPVDNLNMKSAGKLVV